MSSCIGTTYSLYDVEVKRAANTNIKVEPYKIDGYAPYTITNLEKKFNSYHENNRKKFKCISPLEILGLKEENQCWEGTITLRTNFTGWNVINVTTDREALINEETNQTF